MSDGTEREVVQLISLIRALNPGGWCGHGHGLQHIGLTKSSRTSIRCL